MWQRQKPFNNCVYTYLFISTEHVNCVYYRCANKRRTSKSKHVIAYKVNSAAEVVRVWELFSTWSKYKSA